MRLRGVCFRPHPYRVIVYSLMMSHLAHILPLLQVSNTIGGGDIRRLSAPIHILDNDSLLNVFHISRPVLLDDSMVDNDHLLNGGEWRRERWWYKFAQVCQRWRYLILGSASYLQLCLVCTYGTPVADMLAHSPPFPLVLDYIDEDHDITSNDEQAIILALRHRDRVRRIRLQMSISNLQKFVPAIDGEFPILEFLYIEPPIGTTDDTSPRLMVSKTFRAPHLCHLALMNFNFTLESPLLSTSVPLVTLSLQEIYPTYFPPNELLRWLSLMPQLETLGIDFYSRFINSDIEIALLDSSIMTHAALPTLRWFGFGGESAYLEGLLPHVTMPLLEKLQVSFSYEDPFSVSQLLPFMNTKKNLRLTTAKFTFDNLGVAATFHTHEGARTYAFNMDVGSRYLARQVSSLAQIFDALSPVFSAIERLALAYRKNDLPSVGHNEVDRAQWRALLSSFGNVKTLLVDHGLVGEISRFLRQDDGESQLEVLPNLKELSYSSGDAGDRFAGFIDARQAAGHCVTVVRH
ncbi:hypothetical protein BC827DRAFT_1236658 [Russula dissimulans]|nr:hypothetical protein BC827DRAFT_1236658 [Russula dissimulans]